MKTSTLFLAFAIPAYLACTRASAADVPGVVRSGDGSTASVTLTSDLAPAPGDKATIYFLFGGEDEVVVATGSVASVAADSAQIKIENATGTITKDQKVRIVSANPQRRAAMPAKPKDDTGPPPGTPAVRPGIKQIENGDGSITVTIPGKHPGDPPRTITIPAEGEGDPPIIEIPLPDDEVTPFKPVPGDAGHPPVARPELPSGAIPPNSNGLDADNPAAPHFKKGCALHTAGRSREAIAAFTKAIELEPNYATAWYNRARAELDIRDYDTLIADANQALKLGYTNQADTYCLRGSGWAGKNDFDKALADHTKAIELNPRHALAYNNRANDCLRKQDYAGALADCIQSIELDPSSPLPYYNRGYVYSAIGKKQQAVADWTKAVAMQPAWRAELEPLIQSHGGTLPAPDIHEHDTVPETIRRVIPRDADSSSTIRQQ